MNMIEIDKETVKKVAKLARLNLSEKEIASLAVDLKDILNAFEDLEKLDTCGIEPSFQPIEVKNIMREDKPEKGLSQKQALANAKNKEKGYFKGPRAI